MGYQKQPMIDYTKLANAFYRVSAKAVITNTNNEFLFAQESDGILDFLGGGINFGENPQEAIIREIQEETGLKATLINKNAIAITTAKNTNGVWIMNIFYRVSLTDFNFTASNECTDILFLSKEKALTHNVQPAITAFLKKHDEAK